MQRACDPACAAIRHRQDRGEASVAPRGRVKHPERACDPARRGDPASTKPRRSVPGWGAAGADNTPGRFGSQNRYCVPPVLGKRSFPASTAWRGANASGTGVFLRRGRTHPGKGRRASRQAALPAGKKRSRFYDRPGKTRLLRNPGGTPPECGGRRCRSGRSSRRWGCPGRARA